MIATVKAVPPAQFDAWLADQKKLHHRSQRSRRRWHAQSSSNQTGAGQVENP